MQDKRMEGRYQENSGKNWLHRAIELLKWASGTMMSGKILQGRTSKSTTPTESRLIILSPISRFFEKKQTTQTFLRWGLSKLLYHLDKYVPWASLFYQTASRWGVQQASWAGLSWRTQYATLLFTGPVKWISKGALPQHCPHEDL